MKHFSKIALATVATVAAAPAFAVGGPDFTTLTGAIDMTTVTAAVLAVAVLGMGVRLTWIGVKYVFRMTNRL